MTLLECFVHSLQISIPAYVANASPPFLIKFKTHPVDFGRKWKGERILGEGKTIEGYITATVMGLLTGWVELLVIKNVNYANFLQIPLIGFLFIGLGAMIGDSIGSFIKRRLGLERGSNAGLLDQLDFITGSFLLAALFTDYSIISYLMSLVITPFIHRTASVIGYYLGVKREPW